MNEESIFAEACAKKTPAEQAADLDGACGRDEELRNRIEQLLAAHSHPDEFLEAPPPGPIFQWIYLPRLQFLISWRWLNRLLE